MFQSFFLFHESQAVMHGGGGVSSGGCRGRGA